MLMTTHKPLFQARRQFLYKAAPLLATVVPNINISKAFSDESELYPAVVPDYTLSFPRDHGAHPDFRIEWWYLTASMQSSRGPLGIQITFFRSRTPYGRNNPSRFAPQQLMLAHAALALPKNDKLLHDQQSFRVQDTVAMFSTVDTDIAIGLPNKRWQMVRTATDQYRITVKADQFQFSIEATPTIMNTPVLQGDKGFSRKGPDSTQASYYYSRPQLRIEGEYKTDDELVSVSGTGWLDHEWSSELMAGNATGWDWVGLNFNDGTALMAFQMRTDTGQALYSTERYINPNGSHTQNNNNSVKFTPLRFWQSPRTDARYPVSMRLQTGKLDLIIEPLFDDQELDSRSSTGVIYWEGRVEVWNASDVNKDGTKSNASIASGYLELTGYAEKLVI